MCSTDTSDASCSKGGLIFISWFSRILSGAFETSLYRFEFVAGSELLEDLCLESVHLGENHEKLFKRDQITALHGQKMSKIYLEAEPTRAKPIYSNSMLSCVWNACYAIMVKIEKNDYLHLIFISIQLLNFFSVERNGWG